MNNFPLSWPAGWKRAARFERAAGQFKSGGARINVTQAAKRLFYELGRLGISSDGIVISTNVRLTLAGLPAGDTQPVDPGVAVYWRGAKGAQRCIATDRYLRVADNLAAIAATLEAMRSIKRHGGSEILDRVFLGFTSLPSPNESPWWTVLGFASGDNVTKEQAEQNYRQLANKHHPDKGGDPVQFGRISQAITEARKVL